MKKKQNKLGFGILDLTKILNLKAKKIIIALASGILMGLTTAPTELWFLAWIALAPLWVLVVEESKDNKNAAVVSSLVLPLLWGIGYHGVALSWITGIHPMTWMGVPWLASLAIALFSWTFITLWGAALVTLWATLTTFLTRVTQASSSLRILLGVALWCGLELLWSGGALWWTSLSYTQSPHNLAILHLGQISGPNTVTAAIVAVNGLLAEAWINRQPKQRVLNQLYLATAIALLVTLHLIGFGLYSRPLVQPPATALKVGIVQGNIPNEIKLFPVGFAKAIEGYTSGYRTLADQGVDGVLTPEGALPFRLPEVMRSSLHSAILEKGVVAWVGAFGQQGRSITNSLFTFTGNGEVFSRYDKVKMVPLGEYIPFEQYLGGIVDRLSPLDAHQVAGSPDQQFDTPFGHAIVVICYGSAFAEQFRYQAAAGGQFILSPSNDAHYSAAMPAQHHAQDIMRAIESDRWAVRATNTGYSAFVDPHGRTKWISGHNTYELHAETIYRRETKNLYVRWGDWLTWVLLASAAGACMVKLKHL